ncbi:MAG TPA: hypothetical protein VHB72_03150 [Candidatus Saccharimonadales bacterium]|nr:hypothetical protein [Candidatus Saccharimonadales bacterium]
MAKPPVERVPSLDIERPVMNIGPAELAEVQGLMVSDYTSEGERKRLRTLFKKSGHLSAVLVSHAELMRLQKYVGWGSSVTGEHIEELKQYVEEVLPPFSQQEAEVPTLPAEIKPTQGNNASSNILTIASSPDLVAERLFAKQALYNFYRVKQEPQRVWSDDEDTVKVWLASSRDAQTARLLHELDWALESMPGVLPEVTKFGPVNLRHKS